MRTNRKKKTREKLLLSFGNLKDDSFDFDLIAAYFRKKDHTNAFQVVSDKTCNDFDFQDELLKPPKWYFVVRLLSFTNVLALLLSVFNPKMLFVVSGVFCINMVIHYWNKKNLYEYSVSIPQLLKLNGIARELFKNQGLKAIHPTLLNLVNVIDKVRTHMRFFNLDVKFQADAQVLFWVIFEFTKTLFLIEPILLFGAFQRNRRTSNC